MKTNISFNSYSNLKNRKINFSSFILLCLFMFAAVNLLTSQNAAARYEIDAKRIGVNPESKDALPRSREFIRLDSTYYVGWMYEGLYKYERSSDYLGYTQALAPLHKALSLFEKDYDFKLRSIFSSMQYFNQNQNLFSDFYSIASTLEQCYNTVEMPDSTMKLLNKIESYHFQRDFFNIGSSRAWLYHRNRFYNSEKYPFLKNSIKENETMAFGECFKEIAAIKNNKSVNDQWYGYSQSDDDLLTVYHYLALLHDYNQNYDSSQYYYQLLIEGGRVSWSNYANLQHVIGDFDEAIINYSKNQYKRKFSLSESHYYMPMILIYGAQTKLSIQLAQDKINESGSTPGFGWYNIALARGYLYDGQLDSCDFFLNKAANFKELHIGTTLTQSLYEFTINLLRIQMIEKKVALIKFFDTGWWYSFSGIYDVCALKTEKLMLEYNLVNAMANNPERDRIVYDLFCSESTVSFDESMYLLKDFCLPYFEKKYTQYALTDSREKINKYYRLFAAKFNLEEGNEDEARIECKKLLEELYPFTTIDESDNITPEINYSELYTYRLMETLAKSADGSTEKEMYINKCFNSFPQLTLFSDMHVKMNVTFNGLENDNAVQNVIEDLKDCNIDFTDEPNAPKANLAFSKKGDTYQVVINVEGSNNKPIVTNGQLLFKETKGIGKELATRLFGKGGAIKPEMPIN